jgi:long-chain acyl-CoA synthetase
MRWRETIDTISADVAGTLPGLLLERCRRTPDAEAYREFDGAAGCWRSYGWRQVCALAARWQGAMRREGLRPGERVALWLPNGIAWVACDMAAQSLGLVVVPLYVTDHPDNVAYVLGNSGVSLLILDASAKWRLLESHALRFPSVRCVICLEANSSPAEHDALLRPAHGWLPEETGEFACQPLDPDALATLVYTSGTTGRPKGVMLSHRNVLSNAESVLKIVSAFREDVFLSFLPLSHMFERTVGYYVPMMAGSRVAFARSLQDLAADLANVRPTILVSVPSIYEQASRRIARLLAKKAAAMRATFDWAARVGWRRFEAAQGRGPVPGLAARLAWPLLHALVARRVLGRFGGRLRLAVSGGAPLAATISHSLIGLGVPLLQGYGLTEASPVVTANRVGENFPESVGRPLPGIEVRLGERDELLVRGANVMLGYWENPEATREALDPYGWLHTGDQARIVDGRIYIVGRIKEILVLSNGAKVPPGDIELAILEDTAFSQALVVGEGRPFLTALVVLDAESWPELTREARVNPQDPRALESRELQRLLLKRIDRRLTSAPGIVRIHAVHASLARWTIDNGLLTPTNKPRRAEIERRFAAEIEAAYARVAR